MLSDPLLGQQLGNYRIDRLLGRGGMAQVYYGWDVNLERPVAIKVIDSRFRYSPAYASRFVREARAAAAWHHENIIQIYYADETDGLYYFVMEYIKGMDLSELIDEYTARGELIPHADVLRIGRAMAGALDYAHEKGVIHRDVKPANAMIAEDGRIVLTDFGLALDMNQGSIGEVFGSPRYIAPEQARHSADAVPQSDLYSLGVILYEMLTGNVPFDDPSPTAVALQHVTQPPPPPRQINPTLNPETETVLLKALSKSPEERYQTGQELLDALEATLQGTTAAAPAADGKALSIVSINEQIVAHMNAEGAPGGDADRKGDPDLIGLELDEYRLEKLLGHGGMARVYQGLDVRLDRRVAIKVIDTPFRADADYLMRFEREAQAIARLEHPHIVRLYRYGEDHGLLYMAMQFIDGADLGSILEGYQADGEFMTPEDIRRIVREIGEALDYAHEKGVIHRDIKPANVMLDKQGHAILADFGLALLVEAGTRGAIFGSPHYIAPEQAISSANVVPQSDLYAVGVMLYEIFTGQLPFNAADPLEIAMLHMTGTPPPPREVRPDLSPKLEAVILKAMAQDPQARYATGTELADALDQALPTCTPAPIAAPRLTIPERVIARMSMPNKTPGGIPTPPPPPPVKAVTEAAVEIQPAPVETITAAPPPPPPVAAAETPAETVTVTPPPPTATTTAGISVVVSTSPATPPVESQELPTIAIAPTPQPPAPAPVPAPETTTTVTVYPATPATTTTATAAAVTPPPPQPASQPAPSPVAAQPSRKIKLGLYVAIGVGLCLLLALLTGGTLAVINFLQSQAQTTPQLTETPSPDPDAKATLNPHAVSSITESATPTPEPISTATPEPTATPTPEPTATFTPEPTAIPTPIPGILQLFLANKEEGVVLYNPGPAPILLAPLQLGEKDQILHGYTWEQATLDPGQCVSVWKRKGDDDEDGRRLPEGVRDLCSSEHPYETREGKSAFWMNPFAVVYDGQLLGTCSKESPQPCTLNIPVPFPGSGALLIQRRDPASLLVINAGRDALPLADLVLRTSQSELPGSQWELSALESYACVGVKKDEHEDRGSTPCGDPDGKRLIIRDDPFWSEPITVYYREQPLGTCQNKPGECLIKLP